MANEQLTLAMMPLVQMSAQAARPICYVDIPVHPVSAAHLGQRATTVNHYCASVSVA